MTEKMQQAEMAMRERRRKVMWVTCLLPLLRRWPGGAASLVSPCNMTFLRCIGNSGAAIGSRRPRCDGPAGARPSHVRVVGPAATLGRDPVDVLGRILDVAGLAVHAVLRVDHKTGIGARLGVVVHHLVDPR